MTPCEKLGYKVGDRFEVITSNGFFYFGEIVTLLYDDKTSYPMFSNGKEEYFKHLDSVRLIERVSGTIPKNPIEYLKSAHASGDFINPETMLRECYGITKTERVVVEWSDAKREIKVGDKVRIVGPASYTDQSAFMGQVREVMGLGEDETGTIYDIGPVKGGYSFYFPASSVELI